MPVVLAPPLLGSPEPSTGALLSVCVPLPSWPSALEPQHLTPPAVVSAQVWPPPAEIALTPLSSPRTSTGARLPVVVPLPSCPKSFLPQHLTPPSVVSAQVWGLPTSTAATPLARPETSTGTLLSSSVPLPSLPSAL